MTVLSLYQIGLRFAISRESSGKLECLSSVLGRGLAKYSDMKYRNTDCVYQKMVD